MLNFARADIEDMPVTSNYADVVVSNCVLNLVPNKYKVMSEIFRVLKPGGHFLSLILYWTVNCQPNGKK
jgi:ubiquinone/menaquinone biosynthesis C-methylase UbiE